MENRDEIFMREALRIARNGLGRTSPNPMVGAVIVKDDRIIAEGWHRRAGELHAERNALIQAGDLAKNSTMYVTLEPCSHYGRTPPCANALVDAGISRCVVAMKDPNPKVAGHGIEILRNAGIEVKIGICESESRKLNENFLKWITTGLPFVALKFAETLDGKIANRNRDQIQISSAESNRRVHELRDTFDGILVGIETVLNDNPSLTTRLENRIGKNPTRIILDSKLKIPLDAQVLDEKSKTIIATTESADEKKIDILKKFPNVEVIISENDSGRIDLEKFCRDLAAREITSILVEGGGTVNFSLLEKNLVDKIFAIIAPKILGGSNSPTSIDGTGFFKSLHLNSVSTELIGGDIWIESYL
ncbi:MAG: bifunctional diaminohydroxyphosphoribosylaminopyrimidine deaminase/5-amino-6-(5-phosphoribosylamino)uracil reductase RibD [Selenomonadaceae bacterium]|nr:bifunctional diaminohydroxyphosphoribosylaminopyrimidine deaminase/5-amino-6-(5-phosphoribosylamino)uracil reductase RibD [Selenomonadaceae bacterium]